jgi:hypothetical protein
MKFFRKDLLDFFSASSVMNSQIAPLWLYAAMWSGVLPSLSSEFLS